MTLFSSEYSVFVSNAFCNDSALTFLTVHAHPSFNGSTELCSEQQLMLSALENGSDYLWSTGDTTVDIIVSESDLYWNTYLDSNGCTRSDTILIELDDDTLHSTTIVSVDTSTTLTITTGLASAAADNNNVYTYTLAQNGR